MLGQGQLGSILLGDVGDSGNFGFGQAQALIKQTYNAHAQAQADIKQTYNGYGQAQAEITLFVGAHGQAQARILQTYNGYGQAQGWIAYPKQMCGQAQAWICWTDDFNRTTTAGIDGFWEWVPWDSDFANISESTFILDGSKLVNSVEESNYDSYKSLRKIPPNGTISFDIFINEEFVLSGGSWFGVVSGEDYTNDQFYFYVGSNGTDILVGDFGSLNAYIPYTTDGLYHAKFTYRENGDIGYKIWRDGDPEPDWLLTTNLFLEYGDYVTYDTIWIDFGWGDPNIYVDNIQVCIPSQLPSYGFGQAQAQIISFNVNKFAQAQAIINQVLVTGQSQGSILAIVYRRGQARARIKATSRRFGQARAKIKAINTTQFAQAQAVLNSAWGVGQAQALTRRFRWGWGQVRAVIIHRQSYGQAQAYIAAFGTYKVGQAQARIKQIYQGYAQSQAFINQSLRVGQARAVISSTKKLSYAQVRAKIKGQPRSLGQTQARILIKYVGVGQAQALITSFNTIKCAQAQALIKRTIAYGQAQGWINRSDAGNLVKYNNYLLPGYLQSESLISEEGIYTAEVEKFDFSTLSEYTGLKNKFIDISMKVMASTYAEGKEQVHLAGTMLRSNRSDFVRLSLLRTDRYYLAKTVSIKTEQVAGRGERTTPYSVVFEARPWSYGIETHTLTGTIDTNNVGRTLSNGTWTPARVTLTGTNITVSGYTDAGEFTGFISVSGAVTNLVIDSELYTATINGVNRNDVMRNYEYQIYIGPGRTRFATTGVTEITVEYEDRWPL